MYLFHRSSNISKKLYMSPYTHWKGKFKFSSSDLLYGIFDVLESVCQTGKNTKLENSLNIWQRLAYLQLLRMYSVINSIFWLVSKAINTPSVCPHDCIAYTEVVLLVQKTLKHWLPALLYTNCVSSHEATIKSKFN